MARLFLKHSTSYSYSELITESANQILLYPYNDLNQQIVNHQIKITNDPSIFTYLDSYNNRVGFFTYLHPHDNLIIISEAEIISKKIEIPYIDLKISSQWEMIEKLSDSTDFFEFIYTNNHSDKLAIKVIDKLMKSDLTPLNVAFELNSYIYKNFDYVKGVTNVNTNVDDVWQLKSGVCQDFTNIMLQLCRLCKIPSRYVSGYICESKGLRGYGSTHAWVEVFIPTYGWFGLDPTNNCFANDLHIRLAVGKNYNDCSPVKGVYTGNATQQMEVKVHMATKKSQSNFPKTEITPFDKNNIPFESEEMNSYRQNLEKKQQQQQQQQ